MSSHSSFLPSASSEATESSSSRGRPGRNHGAQPGRHRYAERGNDLYETPACAIEALLAVENLPRRIWEPACGPGAIARVLRARGHEVFASDLVHYDSPDQDAHGVDFLLERVAPEGFEAIVTNPPYRLADAFVTHALDLADTVAMLLRLAFLEGKRRTDLIERRGLARVWVFRGRLPMMHRAGWAGPRASSSMAFAWFVWRRSHHGPPTLGRVG